MGDNGKVREIMARHAPGAKSTQVNSVLTVDGWAALDTAIFDGSDVLEGIRRHARVKRLPPVGLLCVLLTRLAAASYPVTVDVGLGGIGLNLHLALVGDSGMGKDRLINASRGAVLFGRDGSDIKALERPIGSGEALVTSFQPVPTEKDEPRSGMNRRVLFTEPEVNSLGVHMSRQGATLRVNLLKLFTCGMLGVATKTQTITVDADGYSAGVIVGVQPGNAGVLLGDSDDGLPQRFLWTELVDPTRDDATITTVANDVLNVVQLPPPETTITGCGEATKGRFAADMRRLKTGHSDGLDSHAALIQARIAALLAILREHADGGFTADDWRRAGALVDYSRRVRESCERRVNSAKALERLTREETEDKVRDDKAQRLILDALEVEDRPVRVSPLQQKARRYRENFTAVLEQLLADGVITYSDQEKRFIRRGTHWLVANSS